VGCGHIGTVHSFALRQLADLGLTDARVAATFDALPARAVDVARHHDAEVPATLEDLLRSVDAVWVTTWTSAHCEVVEAASAAGVAIFCEKPLAPDLPSAERVAASLRRVPHQVGLVLRNSPVFSEVASRLADRRHGRVLAVALRDEQYFPIQGDYRSTWRSDVGCAGGGTLIEHSIHDVDLLRWILGDPADVSARTSTMFGHPGIDDAVAVTFTYPGGAHASLTSVWHQILSRGSTRRLEVFCERAFLWTDDDYLGPLHVESDDGTERIHGGAPEWMAALAVPVVYQKPLAQYAGADLTFLEALQRTPAASGSPGSEIALAAHRLVDAAYRSAKGGGAPVTMEASR